MLDQPCIRAAPTCFFGLHDSNAISDVRFTLTYIWYMNTISRTLALLKPADLYPAWQWIDMMEECGEIEAGEERRWKEGIYGLMVLWRLEPDHMI